MEIANKVEAVQDGRIHIEKINGLFLFREKGTPAPGTRFNALSLRPFPFSFFDAAGHRPRGHPKPCSRTAVQDPTAAHHQSGDRSICCLPL